MLNEPALAPCVNSSGIFSFVCPITSELFVTFFSSEGRLDKILFSLHPFANNLYLSILANVSYCDFVGNGELELLLIFKSEGLTFFHYFIINF